MSKEEEIHEIERIKSSLEYHFQKYKDYKYDSENASRKIVRSRASDNMFTHVKYIESELFNPLVSIAIYEVGLFISAQKYTSVSLQKYTIFN